MVGPDLSARGGMVSVVQGYLDAGLGELCDLRYIGTMVDGPASAKLMRAVSSYVQFRRVVRSYDLVHIHMSKGASYVRKRLLARYARRVGVPYILHIHTGEFAVLFERASAAKKAEVRELFSQAAAVVALSEEWRTYFAEHVCGGENVVVLHNGVDIPKEPCHPEGQRNVLFMGCLDSRKSPDVLLRAMVRILPRHRDARALFAGDGDVDAYRGLAAELGVDGACEFLGWVSGDAREQLFGRAGVYCLPSRHEGLPMGVLEAMAHGIPTVATPVGGVPQVIVDGENGRLMPVSDDAALAAILDGLLASPAERARLGAAGRATVEGRFGIQACIDRLMDLYATVRLRACSST